MNEITVKPAHWGIQYYNEDNNNNENNENKQIVERAALSTNEDTNLASLLSGLATREEDKGTPMTPMTPEEDVGSTAPDLASTLTADEIKSAVIQLFDNGPQSLRRYKLKIRMNLVDKSNPEFIAALTKSWTNFKKYIPLECRENIIEIAREIRADIKSKYGTVAYMGKFHLNTGKSQSKKNLITIEPSTVCFVWYDNTHHEWLYTLFIYEFRLHGKLDEQGLTQKQQSIGVKGQDTYMNAKYSKPRPLTWAEQRKQAQNIVVINKDKE